MASPHSLLGALHIYNGFSQISSHKMEIISSCYREQCGWVYVCVCLFSKELETDKNVERGASLVIWWL